MKNKLLYMKILLILFLFVIYYFDIVISQTYDHGLKQYYNVTKNAILNINNGLYYIKNFQGKYLAFEKQTNDLKIIKDKNHTDYNTTFYIIKNNNNIINIKNKLYSIHNFNNGNLEKVLSAAWGGNSDNFATMYACRVNCIKNKNIDSISSPKNNIIKNDKQFWIFLKMDQYYYITPLAHLNDQKQRCIGSRYHKGNRKFPYNGMWVEECLNKDNDLFKWKIIKV